MKNYTKKQLLKLGWSNIGGRVEDFVEIHETDSPKAAYDAIKKMYSKNADDVWRGVLVYMKYGSAAYYTPKHLERMSENITKKIDSYLSELG